MDLKISQLTLGTPLNTDVVPYVDGVTGTTKKALKSDLQGATGPAGPTGATGAAGPTGATGPAGTAATATAGSTTTGVPGSSASVTNVGTVNAAVFDFVIPRGDVGATGAQGIQGIQGIPGPVGPGSGDVNGPASAVDNRVVFFDGTTGKLIKDSGLTLAGTNTGDNATNTQYSGLAASKQNTLVSGTSIKTVNSISLLGSGDIALVIPVKATAAELAAGTDDAKFATALGLVPFTNDSMNQQAIINGNFDVWQRGTTVTNPADGVYLADRWTTFTSPGGGTLPTTIIHSRQILTSGDIPNAFYYYRINPNGTGTSLGVGAYGSLSQKIEYGTRFLCGLNKQITVSVWARSSIAGKQIGLTAYQYYGTGGSPSALEKLVGTQFTLTSSWVKYTWTFTTATLVGKTFGTNNDEFLQINVDYVWGTSNGYGLTGSETFGGSGTIDIAQVQLCAGSVALPFQPKSYGEELRACQRYYVKFSSEDDAFSIFGVGYASSPTLAYFIMTFPVTMRIKPSATYSAVTDFNINATTASTGIVADGRPTKFSARVAVNVASGLTTGQGVELLSNNKTTAFIAYTAEL